jgi:hypothetical protein
MNTEFDQNYSQIIARGATIDNPIGMLFTAYQVVHASILKPTSTDCMTITSMASFQQ